MRVWGPFFGLMGLAHAALTSLFASAAELSGGEKAAFQLFRRKTRSAVSDLSLADHRVDGGGDVGRYDANASPGLEQEFNFACSHFPAADNEAGAVAYVEKYRKEFHGW